MYGELEYRATLMRNGLLGMVAFVNTTTLVRPADRREAVRRLRRRRGHRAESAVLTKRTRTNLCIDYAWGRQGARGFYLGLQEAF